jgi:hypothetical protein
MRLDLQCQGWRAFFARYLPHARVGGILWRCAGASSKILNSTSLVMRRRLVESTPHRFVMHFAALDTRRKVLKSSSRGKHEN